MCINNWNLIDSAFLFPKAKKNNRNEAFIATNWWRCRNETKVKTAAFYQTRRKKKFSPRFEGLIVVVDWIILLSSPKTKIKQRYLLWDMCARGDNKRAHSPRSRERSEKGKEIKWCKQTNTCFSVSVSSFFLFEEENLRLPANCKFTHVLRLSGIEIQSTQLVVGTLLSVRKSPAFFFVYKHTKKSLKQKNFVYVFLLPRVGFEFRNL